MQILNKTIDFKQILTSLIVTEFLLLILSPLKVFSLIIPFIPVILYAFNLKFIEKEVTLKRLIKYIVIATIIFVITILLYLLFEYHLFEKWRRLVGFISAISFIAVIVKCSFFTHSPKANNNYANELTFLKQLNILYLLFFGLILIQLYHDFLDLQSSSSSMFLNYRWLIVGVVVTSIVFKIFFLNKMNDCSTIDKRSSAPSSNELNEYKSILQYHFEVNNLYLRPDLNKQIISQETHIPITHLNHLFNNYLEVDIHYYIAEYRIAYALKLMHKKGDVYTLNAISYESGFKSRVTFNKYFKIFTNVLPSDYLNQSKRFIS